MRLCCCLCALLLTGQPHYTWSSSSVRPEPASTCVVRNNQIRFLAFLGVSAVIGVFLVFPLSTDYGQAARSTTSKWKRSGGNKTGTSCARCAQVWYAVLATLAFR
jgi:hypothetical protein